MRLDKYLKVSRLIKRRTVANEACDAGRVAVNGKAARASYDVKLNDIIEISFGTTFFIELSELPIISQEAMLSHSAIPLSRSIRFFSSTL